MKTFAELGLSKNILVCLSGIGFSAPTEIQEKAIPPLLTGRDVMASAQTGSGKTGAYALPVIEHLARRAKQCRALVLVPTRELALQVKAEFDRFSGRSHLRTTVLYGGTGYGRQISELRACPDVIVATPGRLFDFVQRGMADLSKIEALILDEADRLLDMGFLPQVRDIVEHVPSERLTAMFSATIDERIERLAGEFLNKPVRVAAVANQVEPASIDQRFHKTSEPEKEALLKQVIVDAGQGSVLVFTKTRRKATNVAARLRALEIQAHEIHGDISQNQREKTLERYRSGKFSVLVATDVAARGLDIPAISHVVNYDLPQSPADYVHRIGRTGRAGRSGCAHTFVCDGDRGSLREIEKIVGRSLMIFPTAQKRDSARGRSRRRGPAGENAMTSGRENSGRRTGEGKFTQENCEGRVASKGRFARENSSGRFSAQSGFAGENSPRGNASSRRASASGANSSRGSFANGNSSRENASGESFGWASSKSRSAKGRFGKTQSAKTAGSFASKGNSPRGSAEKGRFSEGGQSSGKSTPSRGYEHQQKRAEKRRSKRKF